ncbi:MAG: ribosome maturation factor RimM [Bacteroidales bacterium]|nr:ribosome maturation factor RimM [Bacteroidales bacterium]
MIKPEEVVKIGMFNKPHGVRGELMFSFTNDIFDRTDCDYVVCMMDGILVPFFIEEYRFRSDTTALMKLERINTAEEARQFTNIDVYFPMKYIDEVDDDIVSWQFFEGFQVIDTHHGPLGTIVAVDDSTANVLFVIEDERHREILLPAHEEFIVQLDKKTRTITVEAPEGLI